MWSQIRAQSETAHGQSGGWDDLLLRMRWPTGLAQPGDLGRMKLHPRNARGSEEWKVKVGVEERDTCRGGDPEDERPEAAVRTRPQQENGAADM